VTVATQKVKRLLAISVAVCFVAALTSCSRNPSGTYICADPDLSEILEFRPSGDVYINNKVAAKFHLDGDRVVIAGAMGSIILTRVGNDLVINDGTKRHIYQKQTADDKQPRSFEWTYKFNDPEPGVRVWTRDGITWSERYPSGLVTQFRAIGRATVDGTSGTVVQPVTDPNRQIFIPDRGSQKMWLWLRHGDVKWGFMGAMEKVE
jgi:hypothetical protein